MNFKEILTRITAFLEKKSRVFLVLFSFLLVIGVGLADFLTGLEIYVSIFYIIPVSITAWFVSSEWGVIMSVFSAVIWITADLMTDHVYSHFAIPVWNAIVRLGFFLVISIILSGLKSLLDFQRELADKDGLTGIANGRCFYYALKNEIQKSSKYKKPFTVAYIDIDDFKRVNDRLGHLEGDYMLKKIATAINDAVRTADIAARMGGDEFGILMPETQEEQAGPVINRVREKICNLGNKGYNVHVSIGVVTFYDMPPGIEDVLNLTDYAMYAVKKSGKDGVKYEVFGKKGGD